VELIFEDALVRVGCTGFGREFALFLVVFSLDGLYAKSD